MKGRKEGGEWRVGGKKETREREDERGERRSKEGEMNFTLSFGYLTFILSPNHSLHPSLQAPPQSSCSSSTYVYTCKMVKFSSTFHHVSLREVLQPMNETDHVVTHRRTVNTINKPTSVKSCIFSLEKRRGKKSFVTQVSSS